MKGHVSGHKCGGDCIGSMSCWLGHCSRLVYPQACSQSLTFVLLHQMQIDKTHFVCFLFLFVFWWEGVRFASILQKEKGGGGAFIKPIAPLLSVLHTALSLTASTSLALFPHVPAG